MPNEIIVTPRIIDIAVGVEKKLLITGSSDKITPGINTFDANWFDYSPELYDVNSGAHNIRKLQSGGSSGVLSKLDLNAKVPFRINCQTANYEVLTSLYLFGIEFQASKKRSQFSSSRPSYNNPNLYRWSFTNEDVLVIPDQATGRSLESWEFNSDGTTIFYLRGGQIVFQATIPADEQIIKMFFISENAGQTYHNVNLFVPEQRESVNAQTVNFSFVPEPDIEVRIPSPNEFFIKPLTAVNRRLTFYHPATGILVVPVTVSSVYIKPVNPLIVHTVQQLDTVQFQSNAVGGAFTASNGLIVDSVNLVWQAIGLGHAILRYEINGYAAEYHFEVIPRIELSNVIDGYYQEPLAQGERTQFVANTEGAYECTNYPNCITPSGFLVCPSDASNDQFGKIDLQIRFTAFNFAFDFIVEVLPMYPNSQVPNGVIHEHWEQAAFDYLPVIKKTIGGRKESRNENENGVVMWRVEYSNLRFGYDCAQDKRFSAKRLDDFYKLVTMTDYFSVIDVHTKILYKNVTIEKYERSHEELYSDDQVRSVELYYDGGETKF